MKKMFMAAIGLALSGMANAATVAFPLYHDLFVMEGDFGPLPFSVFENSESHCFYKLEAQLHGNSHIRVSGNYRGCLSKTGGAIRDPLYKGIVADLPAKPHHIGVVKGLIIPKGTLIPVVP